MTIIAWILENTGSDSMKLMFKRLIRGEIEISSHKKGHINTADALRRRGLATMRQVRGGGYIVAMSQDAKTLMGL